MLHARMAKLQKIRKQKLHVFDVGRKKGGKSLPNAKCLHLESTKPAQTSEQNEFMRQKNNPHL